MQSSKCEGLFPLCAYIPVAKPIMQGEMYKFCHFQQD